MQQFSAKHPWAILAAGAAIQVLTGLPAAWGVFQQPVMDEYGLSEQGAGYAFGLLIAAFGVGCVIGGFLQDRKGPRCAALWGTALLCGGFFAAALLPGEKGGFFFGAFSIPAGLGTAFLYPSIQSCAQKWYKGRKGLATGVIGGAVGLSGAFLTVFVRTALKGFGWDNHAPITNVKNGNIIGYKYFGFGGLNKDKLGLKAFEGTKKGNQTAFNLFLTPKTSKTFKVNVWLDGPWDNETWKGTKIGEIVVPANSAQKTEQFTMDVSKFVDHLDKKHAIYLVAESEETGNLFDLAGLGFSSNKKKITRPIVPKVNIEVNGKAIEVPATPVRSTESNGITGYDIYEAVYKLPAGTTGTPTVSASATDKNVKVEIIQATSISGTAIVKFDYKGVVKTYKVVFTPLA